MPAKPNGFHPDDVFHVIIDAVSELKIQIEDDGLTPWHNYTSEPDEDPKSTRDGYLAMLELAQSYAESALNRQRSGQAIFVMEGNN